jgi:hypothetical protein
VRHDALLAGADRARRPGSRRHATTASATPPARTIASEASNGTTTPVARCTATNA